MPRFFLTASNIENGRATITGGDAHHIARVLRMTRGDELTVVDMQKNEYVCSIISIGEDEVVAEICGTKKSENEPPFCAVLYQALPKGDKMDYIIQKAVELGVFEIVPVLSERCVSRPDSAGIEKKITRWQKISASAASQSGRGIIPRVSPMMTYSQAVESASLHCHSLLCYEGDGTVPLGSVIGKDLDGIGFIIGPEGGFSCAEVSLARAAGLKIAGLGKRILRTETAAGFVLSCLTYITELSD